MPQCACMAGRVEVSPHTGILPEAQTSRADGSPGNTNGPSTTVLYEYWKTITDNVWIDEETGELMRNRERFLQEAHQVVTRNRKKATQDNHGTRASLPPSLETKRHANGTTETQWTCGCTLHHDTTGDDMWSACGGDSCVIDP